MPNRFLILGTTGMLARAWVELLRSRGVSFEHIGRPAFDLGKPETMATAIVGRGFTHVVNCAAWTDVDGAEANEAAATVVNGTGVGHLSAACAKGGAMLVHYSTDYVFNGSSDTPYRTDQTRDPLNAYGRSKAVGEQLIEGTRGLRWLCLRTSWLYAPWGKNFLRTIANAALARPVLKVVNDQRGRPTSSEHLARASLAMIEADATGMHHATDGGECSWYDFACEIVQTLQRTMPDGTPIARVEPCTTAEFPRPAKRPAYSVLDLSTTERVIGAMPDWRGLVADAVRRRDV